LGTLRHNSDILLSGNAPVRACFTVTMEGVCVNIVSTGSEGNKCKQRNKLLHAKKNRVHQHGFLIKFIFREKNLIFLLYLIF